jgi:hypothetical protein
MLYLMLLRRVLLNLLFKCVLMFVLMLFKRPATSVVRYSSPCSR